MGALEKLFGKKKVQTKKAVLTPSVKKGSLRHERLLLRVASLAVSSCYRP